MTGKALADQSGIRKCERAFHQREKKAAKRAQRLAKRADRRAPEWQTQQQHQVQTDGR